MKNLFIKISFLILTIFTLTACNRDDEFSDDLPQEELSNALLIVKDNADGTTASYNFQVNGSSTPTIKLINGHSYTVEIALKNGAEDVTQEIKDAKDEHFFVYDFPNSDIELTRLDPASSTRADGVKVGLITNWKVNTASKSAGAQVVLTLFHEAVSVTEDRVVNGNGFVFGTHVGGETDLKANYNISN